MHTFDHGSLVWISKRHGLNPANIIDVFYGTGGEIQITLIGGRTLSMTERDLSSDGKALLVPHEDQVRTIGIVSDAASAR